MVFDGWGELPAPMTIMVMGSGGRGENYLLSDQDNGFIIGDYPDSEHMRIDTYFREFAEQMCQRLNDAGLPYCSGYCMAINPLWRKTLPQWSDQIVLWVKKSNFIALRLADIFFDFQPVWGDAGLANELRGLVTQRARSEPLFLRQMFREIKTSKVALGVFGNIATEKDERLDLGKVHLKYSGIVPLVEAIRLLALRGGVEETSTLERIRVLNERGALDDDESDDLSGAFHVITDLVLRKEAKDFPAGLRLSYDFYPDSMSGQDRMLLVESLRAIRRLRRRLRHELLEEAL
jgi:signal-transduction protein with cAMP-binding, CBS, and nucleotidyltransferase domain